MGGFTGGSKRRTNEVGCTLNDRERELVGQAADATGKKLATYMRDALLEAARRDAATVPPAPTPGALDLDELLDRLADRMFSRMAQAGIKKTPAEDPA